MAIQAQRRYRSSAAIPAPTDDFGLSVVVVTILAGLLALVLVAAHAIPTTPVSGPRGGGPLQDNTSSGATYIEYSAPDPAPTQPAWMPPSR